MPEFKLSRAEAPRAEIGWANCAQTARGIALFRRGLCRSTGMKDRNSLTYGGSRFPRGLARLLQMNE